MVKTTMKVLKRNRVHRGSSRDLSQLPDRFYGSIVAHLVGKADARVVEQHITEGFQHHGLSPDPSGINRAVRELIAEANGWDRRGKVNSRVEEIAEREQFLRDNEELFGQLAVATAPQYGNPIPLVADYPTLSDGNVYHHQNSGWRMVVDTIMERLEKTRQPDRNGPDWNPDLHVQYEEMTRRQLAYPFVAAWRLAIEVAMKETLITIHDATGSPITPALKNALKSHRIDNLWNGIKNELPVLDRMTQSAAAQDLGPDPAAPGLILDPTRHNDAVAHLISIDPDGQSVRYQRDQRDNLNMRQITRIDLAGLHDEMSVLHSYLGHLQRLSHTLTSLSWCKASLAGLRAGDPLYPIMWARV